jgi:hypothetical protein
MDYKDKYMKYKKKYNDLKQLKKMQKGGVYKGNKCNNVDANIARFDLTRFNISHPADPARGFLGEIEKLSQPYPWPELDIDCDARGLIRGDEKTIIQDLIGSITNLNCNTDRLNEFFTYAHGGERLYYRFYIIDFANLIGQIWSHYNVIYPGDNPHNPNYAIKQQRTIPVIFNYLDNIARDPGNKIIIVGKPLKGIGFQEIINNAAGRATYIFDAYDAGRILLLETTYITNYFAPHNPVDVGISGGTDDYLFWLLSIIIFITLLASKLTLDQIRNHLNLITNDRQRILFNSIECRDNIGRDFEQKTIFNNILPSDDVIRRFLENTYRGHLITNIEINRFKQSLQIKCSEISITTDARGFRNIERRIYNCDIKYINFITNRIINEEITPGNRFKDLDRDILANYIENFLNNTSMLRFPRMSLREIFSIQFFGGRFDQRNCFYHIADNFRNLFNENERYPDFSQVKFENLRQLELAGVADLEAAIGREASENYANLLEQNRYGTKFILYLFLAQIYIFGGIGENLDVINHLTENGVGL